MWLRDFTLIMRSSISAMVDWVEDPERMLHQLIIDMEEELDSIRDSVAGAIADEIQLGKRVEEARKEATEWLSRAETALKRGDEAKARAAIEQRGLAQERAEQLEKEHLDQREQTAKLQRAIRDLENKIRQARHKKALLTARLANAQTKRRINRTMNCATSRSAFAQFSKLERRVERAEALEKAYDRLDDRDPDAEELEDEFEKKEREENLKREFDQLKAKVGSA